MRLFCVVLSQVKKLHNLDLQRSCKYGFPAGKPRLRFFCTDLPLHRLFCFPMSLFVGCGDSTHRCRRSAAQRANVKGSSSRRLLQSSFPQATCRNELRSPTVSCCINRGRIISAPTRLHYLSVAVFLRANFVRHYGVSLEMDCKIPLCQVDKLVFPHTFRFAVQSAILCGSNAIT